MAARKIPKVEVSELKLKRSGILTKIIVIVLIAYAAITLIRLFDKIETGKAQLEQLREQADSMEVENADMRYQIEHSGSDEVKEEIARDELGLVKQGEMVYSGK